MQNKVLLHWPLLAFAKTQGDELTSYTEDSGGSYTMPLRLGVPFLHYPWSQHAQVAIDCTKNFVQSLNAWNCVEESVENKSLNCLARSAMEDNIAQRNLAQVHTLPRSTVLCAFLP